MARQDHSKPLLSQGLHDFFNAVQSPGFSVLSKSSGTLPLAEGATSPSSMSCSSIEHIAERRIRQWMLLQEIEARNKKAAADHKIPPDGNKTSFSGPR